MRTLTAVLMLLVCLPCYAQKWIDENGKVYYGAPPAGVKVRPAPMTGGATSSVGSQGGGASSSKSAGLSPKEQAMKDFEQRQKDLAAKQREEWDRRRAEQMRGPEQAPR